MQTYKQFRFQHYPYPNWLPSAGGTDMLPMPYVAEEPSVLSFFGKIINTGWELVGFNKERASLISFAYYSYLNSADEETNSECEQDSVKFSDELLGELIQNFAQAAGLKVHKPADHTWEDLLGDAAHWYYHVSKEDYWDAPGKKFLPRSIVFELYRKASIGIANPDMVRLLKRANAEVYAILARREAEQMPSLEPYWYMKSISGALFAQTARETNIELYERILSAQNVREVYKILTSYYAPANPDLAVDVLLDLGRVYDRLKPANYVDWAIVMRHIEDFLWEYYVQLGSELPDDLERATDRCRLVASQLCGIATSSKNVSHALLCLPKVEEKALRRVADALEIVGIRLDYKDKTFQLRVAAIYDVLWQKLIAERREENGSL